MLRYVVSRLLVAALMVLLATLVIFLIANMVPGDPVLTQLGDIAANNPDMVADFRHKWGLDLPLWDRYWIFLTGVFHGDLGISIGSQRPVLDDIAQYAPATVELSTIAFLLVAAGRPAARRARGDEARYLGRSSGAHDLAGRRIRADLLARLHHARGVLRRAGMGTRARADQRQHVPAAHRHRHHADRRATGRRLGYVLGCRRRISCCRRSCWPPARSA